jgi:hypothetical protein
VAEHDPEDTGQPKRTKAHAVLEVFASIQLMSRRGAPGTCPLEL